MLVWTVLPMAMGAWVLSQEGGAKLELSWEGSPFKRSLVRHKVTPIECLNRTDGWKWGVERSAGEGMAHIRELQETNSINGRREWRGSPCGRKNQCLLICINEDIRPVQMTLAPYDRLTFFTSLTSPSCQRNSGWGRRARVSKGAHTIPFPIAASQPEPVPRWGWGRTF